MKSSHIGMDFSQGMSKQASVLDQVEDGMKGNRQYYGTWRPGTYGIFSFEDSLLYFIGSLMDDYLKNAQPSGQTTEAYLNAPERFESVPESQKEDVVDLPINHPEAHDTEKRDPEVPSMRKILDESANRLAQFLKDKSAKASSTEQDDQEGMAN